MIHRPNRRFPEQHQLVASGALGLVRAIDLRIPAGTKSDLAIPSDAG